MDVTAVLLSLLGVALGTVGTLTGQFLATRGEARRHATERAAAVRGELKDAIVAYLDAVQAVEQLIDTGTGRADVDDLLHAMWLRKKVLELLSDESLAHTAHRYTSTLHRLTSSGTGITATADIAATARIPTATTGAATTGMPITKGAATTGTPTTKGAATTGTPTATDAASTGAPGATTAGALTQRELGAERELGAQRELGAEHELGTERELGAQRKRLRAEFMVEARAALKV